MALPGAAGIGVVEPALTAAPVAAFDTNLAETSWCCYASPASYSTSGNRTFFVNQTGDIIGTDFATYTGNIVFTATNVGAAFAAGGGATLITGRIAVGSTGRDTNVWKQIN
jgi:hypothetical protein